MQDDGSMFVHETYVTVVETQYLLFLYRVEL